MGEKLVGECPVRSQADGIGEEKWERIKKRVIWKEAGQSAGGLEQRRGVVVERGGLR